MIESSDMDRKIVLGGIEASNRLGEEIAGRLKPGDVAALTGELGTGKTSLCRAIAKGLGVAEEISSPTFNVVKEYLSGRLPVYHFDVYRVSDPDELFELGFDEYLHGDGVCLIEWADLIEDMLPADCIRIDLSFGENEGERIAELSC